VYRGIKQVAGPKARFELIERFLSLFAVRNLLHKRFLFDLNHHSLPDAHQLFLLRITTEWNPIPRSAPIFVEASGI
jgi:hypothetical protein